MVGVAQAMIVRLSHRQYRVERSWARVPSAVKVGLFSKAAVDRAGNLYLCQRADPPILVFGPDGSFIKSVGSAQVDDAHGICISPDGSIFVVDRDRHQVLAFDAEGKIVTRLGERDTPAFQAPFSHPTDVAVAATGDIYVADGYGNAVVHRFAADGRLRRTWGGFGDGPGHFITPHGIHLLRDGRVLVGDRENNRVQIFDPEGNYLSEITGLFHPMDIYVDSDDTVFISDQVPSIQARGADGAYLGRCKPPVASPHGLTGDVHGNLFVVDPRMSEVMRLTPV